MNLTPDQTAWIDRARDAEILDVAQRAPIAAKLKRHSREWVAPELRTLADEIDKKNAVVEMPPGAVDHMAARGSA